LSRQPDLLSDAQLIQLAHALAPPRVAAYLISTGSDRDIFNDLIQRIYTDDGHGDGRVTAKSLPILEGPGLADKSRNAEGLILDATVPLLLASRAELVAKADHLQCRC